MELTKLPCCIHLVCVSVRETVCIFFVCVREREREREGVREIILLRDNLRYRMLQKIKCFKMAQKSQKVFNVLEGMTSLKLAP